MNARTWKMIYIIAACIATLGAILLIGYLFLENGSLKETLNNRTLELEAANGNISALQKRILLNERTIQMKDADIANLTDSLEDTESRLNQTETHLILTISELNGTREELQNKSVSLEESRQQFSALKTEIADFQESLQESIEWFKSNSRLPPSVSYFAPYIRNNCVQDRQLNLACVSYMMERRLGYHYISESTDRLYSLDEMIARGGGDCEDYALFVRANLNNLNDTTSSVSLLSWTPGSGVFTVYQTADETWYYGGSKVELAKLGSVTPEAFCYVTGYSDGVVNGHCIVALDKNPFSNESDLQGLNGADAFEPQDGRYKGRIGIDYQVCENGEIDCGKNPGDIMIVMSDDDLYQFRDGKWKSFKGFRENLSTYMDQIDIILR